MIRNLEESISRFFKAKKSLSLDWRIALYVALIGSFLCFVAILILKPFQYGRIEQEIITEAHILAEAISVICERLGEDEPKDRVRGLLLRVARAPYISLVNVYNQNNLVLYSTDQEEVGRKYNIKYGIVNETNEIWLTQVNPHNVKIGGVSIKIDKSLIADEVDNQFFQLGIGLLIIIILLSFLVKGLVEKLVSSRLLHLMSFIENAEQGSFLARAKIDRFDEIGHVILGFNQLLGVITQIETKHVEKDLALEDAEAQRSIRQKLEEVLEELKRSNEKLSKKVQAQELLMQAAHRLGGTLNRDAIVDRLVQLILEKLKWQSFKIFLIDKKNPDNPFLELLAEEGFNKTSPAKTKFHFNEGITGMVAQTGSPIVINHPDKHSLPDQFKSMMSVPMIHKSKVIGVMDFFLDRPNGFDKEDEILLCALGAQAALAFVNAELYEATLELATIDPLTGVMNRRALEKQIQYEFARSERFNNQMALLLIDVDFFKSYNDRMGHVLGDQALIAIAKVLLENLRKVDTLARFGGEEFCVILPQTDLAAAMEVAQKLNEAIRKIKLRGTEKQEFGYLSVSIGIVLAPSDIKNISAKNIVNTIIETADKALYEAKRQGRDRFVHIKEMEKTS